MCNEKRIGKNRVHCEIVGYLRQNNPRGIELLSDQFGPTAKKMLAARFRQSLNQIELDAAFNGALFKAWKYGRSVDEKKNLQGWFFRICMNEAIELCKRSAKHRTHDLSRLIATPVDQNTGQTNDSCFLVQSLRAAIEQLPPLQKSILTADLQERGEENAKALAKRFGTSANSIRVSRSKAKERIRNQLIAEFTASALAT